MDTRQIELDRPLAMPRDDDQLRLMTTARRPVRRFRQARRGAVTLELILAFPIWLIFLLAIVDYVPILSNAQQLAFACPGVPPELEAQ